MGFDIAVAVGALFGNLFLGAVAAVAIAKALGTSARNGWCGAVVITVVLAVVTLSPESIVGGIGAAITFLMLAILNKPLPKFS